MSQIEVSERDRDAGKKYDDARISLEMAIGTFTLRRIPPDVATAVALALASRESTARAEGYARGWNEAREATRELMMEAATAAVREQPPVIEDLVDEILAERSLAASRRELDKWREREAGCCPEDVGFDEVIAGLRRECDRLRKALGSYCQCIEAGVRPGDRWDCAANPCKAGAALSSPAGDRT